MNADETLEQAAQAREEAAQALATAQVRLAKVQPEYDAALREVRAAKDRLRQVESGMGAVKHADAIRRALEAAGVEYDGPLVIVAQAYRPEFFYLSAVGPQGTGLYVSRPERPGRHSGTERCVRIAQAQAHGVTEEPRGNGMAYGMPSWRDAGMWAWQRRGKGDLGLNGAYRPLAPPEGGKWKWLKVSEQRELVAS